MPLNSAWQRKQLHRWRFQSDCDWSYSWNKTQKWALLLNSLLEQLAFSKYILIVSYLILDSVPKTSHGEQSCPNQADIPVWTRCSCWSCRCWKYLEYIHTAFWTRCSTLPPFVFHKVNTLDDWCTVEVLLVRLVQQLNNVHHWAFIGQDY